MFTPRGIETAQEALELVAEYYKTTVPEIERTITQYGGDVTSVESILGILLDDGATAYDLIYNADGSVRTLVYDNITDYLNSGASATLNAMHQINSNATATAVAEKTKLSAPVQAALNAAGTGLSFKVGATAVKTGLATTTVVNPISAGIAGVAAGVALGVGIDAALYKLNPHFWTDLGFTDVDPAEYAKIVDPAGLFTGLFKTDADAGTSQMYLDEEALAYIAKYLNGKGAFVPPRTTVTTDEIEGFTVSGLEVANRTTTVPVPDYPNLYYGEPFEYGINDHTWKPYPILPVSSENGLNVKCAIYEGVQYGSHFGPYMVVASSKRVNNLTTAMEGGYGTGGGSSPRGFEHDGKRVYYCEQSPGNPLSGPLSIGTSNVNDAGKIAWTLFYGTETTSGGAVDGITQQQNAKTPNISNDDTVAEVLAKLKEQYPGLWDDALTINTPQPDGTFKTYTYVPVGSAVASSRFDTQPTNTTQTQTDTAVNVNTSPEELVDTIIQTTTSKPTKQDVNTGTNTGSGGTPIVPPVTGKASALYSIYNPTLEQVNSLGAWLWSSNFIDQLLKLFASPMDAIIGLHKIYATPATGAAQNIKVGYLDSGVPSKIVTEQYTTIDCGTVNCYEYFGNVLDYNPYTNIRLYLPFIGIIDLSNSDVMRSNINVVYHVDVLSGACLAEVKITRDGGGGTLYQYAGNAATTLPISSGSYMGVVSSVSSVATRALAGFASGGALGAIASGATGVLNAQGTNVVHSGGFSGNAGAMGCKKPYLIIERPQTETADNTAKLLGYGSNLFTKLKTCKGLTRVKGVHVDAVPATKEEKKLIEEKLMDGIIIS